MSCNAGGDGSRKIKSNCWSDRNSNFGCVQSAAFNDHNLGFVFIIIPILYWGIRLAWWLIRVAFISLLILIYLAGRAWRGELTR